MALNAIIVMSISLLAADTASECVDRGMRAFREGRVAESLDQFDRAITIEQRIEPYLWQRGISQYCVGQYDAGRKQFEIHKEVNPHDVENAAWHYLCVGKLKGVEYAKKQVMTLDSKRDSRVPMHEIYQMISGKGSPEQVLATAARDGTPRSLMYAHLYIGLQYELMGKSILAKKHLALAVQQPLEGSYMQDVARICHTRYTDQQKSVDVKK